MVRCRPAAYGSTALLGPRASSPAFTRGHGIAVWRAGSIPPDPFLWHPGAHPLEHPLRHHHPARPSLAVKHAPGQPRARNPLVSPISSATSSCPPQDGSVQRNVSLFAATWVCLPQPPGICRNSSLSGATSANPTQRLLTHRILDPSGATCLGSAQLLSIWRNVPGSSATWFRLAQRAPSCGDLRRSAATSICSPQLSAI